MGEFGIALRHVTYISGTRADFGLMRSTLETIARTPGLSLSVIVTGMHLSPAFGDTAGEIEQAGLRISHRVPTALEPATGATMARGIGTMLGGFVSALEDNRPDVVLLLGDRGEMLAGALAAIHLNIVAAHVCGGERSGTVDEPVRHAISKLSHLHFTATQEARERLIRMGELAQNVHVVGAPGLDGLLDTPIPSRADLMDGLGLNPHQPVALMVYHPVLQEADNAAAQASILLSELRAANCQVLALMPNADAGSAGVRAVLENAKNLPGVAVRNHLPRPQFLGAMAIADIMVGNSSSGIVEAASFGTPVLNVGIRQNLRERNANVRDVACTDVAVRMGIAQALSQGRCPVANVYGDGKAGMRIAALLAQAPLGSELLMKANSY